MTPSRDQDGEHDTSKMITANYCREPRDLEHAKRVLIECAGMASHERACEHVGALGIHPEVPAAMGLTHGIRCYPLNGHGQEARGITHVGRSNVREIRQDKWTRQRVSMHCYIGGPE